MTLNEQYRAMSLGTVISLCDMTGNMVQPWLDAGYKAITVDLQMSRMTAYTRHHLAQGGLTFGAQRR
jgi:hypothetical protein